MDEFYLQDSRGYVGNDVLWWAKEGKGYTTNLHEAHVFTKDEAVKQHDCRETDIPWPKDYIDAKTRPAVDMQYIDRKEALRGTGIKLKKPQRPRRPIYRCFGCGRFLTEADNYSASGCPKCGQDNRP